MPPGGSPTLQSGGQNQKWPGSGLGGYITPAALGVATALERGAESEVAHKWARWLHNPCRLGGPHRFKAGAEPEVAHKWARWLHNPYCLGGPHRFRAGARNHRWPTSGESGYIRPCRLGVPTALERGRNQRWPTSGESGYMTVAAWGVPTASQREAESEVAQKWAWWLHNPDRLGRPRCFRPWGKIRGGPQVGKVAT